MKDNPFPLTTSDTSLTRQIAIVGLLAGLFFSAASARAQLSAYAVDVNDNLYSVNLTTAAKTLIGNTGVFYEGLAISPSGNLFGTDSNGNLYSINKITGASTFIGGTGLGNIEGLDFNGNTLLGADFSTTPTFYSINTANASVLSIVTATSAIGAVRSLATLDANNVLVRGDAPVFNTLYKLNLGTGNATSIGTMSGDIFAAMDFAADGNLYALDDNGSLYMVNPLTAGLTLIGNTGGDFWLDMAAQVPEPGSVTLLGVGLLISLRFARSRRANKAL